MVMTLVAARPAWGVKGSFGQSPNVPGTGIKEIRINAKNYI